MKKIYIDKYMCKGLLYKVTYYLLADGGVYRYEERFKEGVKISQLFCKVLNKISDWEQLLNLATVKAGVVSWEPITKQASESLDYFSVDNGGRKVAFEINSDLVIILRKECESNGFN